MISFWNQFLPVHVGMHMSTACWPVNLCCGAISCPVSQFNYKPPTIWGHRWDLCKEYGLSKHIRIRNILYIGNGNGNGDGSRNRRRSRSWTRSNIITSWCSCISSGTRRFFDAQLNLAAPIDWQWCEQLGFIADFQRAMAYSKILRQKHLLPSGQAASLKSNHVWPIFGADSKSWWW